MSYRIEEVDQVLTCGICSKVYVDPRVLPCSESACNTCIRKSIERNPKKEFDCNFCHKKHKPSSEKGFLLNGALIKLLKTKVDVKNKDDVNHKVDKVYRDVNINELKSKLAEIKNKCEQFKFSLDNGVDQVREHCIRLRNQVHLETDILIEKAHNFNEILIAEIDKYEQGCIYSFNSKTTKKDNEFDKFILELTEFHSDKTNHLTEFENDEKVVGEEYAKADDYLRKFKNVEKSLKKAKFNGKVAEFRKCQNKHAKTLIGNLTYNSLTFEIDNFKKLMFNDKILKSYYSNINIFKHDDGDNFIFYENFKSHLNMISFSDDGRVIQHNFNVLHYNGDTNYSYISKLKVANSFNDFIIYVKVPNANRYKSIAIFGNTFSTDVVIDWLMIKIDRNFTYHYHKVNVIGKELVHMAANSSNVLCVDSEYNYYCLDMSFNVLSDKLVNVFTSQVGNAIVDVQMSDKYVFFLCNDSKLKIFGIESGLIVKEIDSSANQIKLASTDRLFLFDSNDQIIHVHEQAEEFCKLDEVDLAQLLEEGIMMNRDKSSTLIFFNLTFMKYSSFQ
jgi:hypothetical protein